MDIEFYHLLLFRASERILSPKNDNYQSSPHAFMA